MGSKPKRGTEPNTFATGSKWKPGVTCCHHSRCQEKNKIRKIMLHFGCARRKFAERGLTINRHTQYKSHKLWQLHLNPRTKMGWNSKVKDTEKQVYQLKAQGQQGWKYPHWGNDKTYVRFNLLLWSCSTRVKWCIQTTSIQQYTEYIAYNNNCFIKYRQSDL